MMSQRTWFITGVSSAFGRELSDQLLEPVDRVVGTVRDIGKVADLPERHPETLRIEELDVNGPAAIREVIQRTSLSGRIDVVISNAGYGLFGAAEELTDKQIDKQHPRVPDDQLAGLGHCRSPRAGASAGAGS